MKDQKSTFRKLKEICSINPPLGVKVEPDTLVSFLPMEDVAENGGRIGYQARQRSQIALGLTAFRNDDILIAKITPCFENEKGWLANGLEAGVGFGSTELHVIRCGKEILPRFVYAHTLLPQFRLRGKRYMTGSAGQQRVPASFLNDYVIWVPDLQLQSAICRVDVAYERSLLTFDRLIAAKRAQKRGLMQQLLTGKLRFPGFTEPWKTVRLEEVVSLRNSKAVASEAPDLHCIELEHIEQGTGELIGRARAGSTVSLKTEFASGDVLFGKLRPYLKKFALVDFAGFCSTEIWAITANRIAITSAYLRLLVESPAIQRAANATSGTKMPRADWDVVAATAVKLPSIVEQERITALTSTIEAELRLLNAQRAAFAAQRRGLMEKLLSGEIDIQNPKETAA